MNAKQRKVLEECYSQLEEIKSKIDSIAEEEGDKFDNLSEGLQQAESGQKIEAAKEALESASSDLDQVIAYVEEVKDA